MEEHLSPLAITHLLQHTLRSFCNHDNSQWVYAVFWRILPRNYPPPRWDGQGAYDRSRGNRRNWILVWEDGFCNFAASSAAETVAEAMNNECPTTTSSASASAYDQFQQQHYHHPHQGLQPELFFKMSHEIYNYGEGLIGKVAADHSHKWIYKEPNEQEINFLSSWHNAADSQPRTWEAQFQSGIKTIALIAVREGVVQLGAVHKVVEDLSYVVMLRKKLSYIESIPGVLLPHPPSSSAAAPILPLSRMDAYGYNGGNHPMLPPPPLPHHYEAAAAAYYGGGPVIPLPADQLYVDENHHHHHMMMMSSSSSQFKIAPSMSSLEALLSKLPSVVPPPPHQQPRHEFVAKEEETPTEGDGLRRRHHGHDHDDHDGGEHDGGCKRHEVGGSSSSMTSSHGKSSHRHHQFHLHQHDLNVNCSTTTNNGYFE